MPPYEENSKGGHYRQTTKSRSRGQRRKVPTERSYQVKYESLITYHSQNMANFTVFAGNNGTDGQERTICPRSFRYGGTKMNNTSLFGDGFSAKFYNGRRSVGDLLHCGLQRASSQIWINKQTNINNYKMRERKKKLNKNKETKKENKQTKKQQQQQQTNKQKMALLHVLPVEVSQFFQSLLVETKPNWIYIWKKHFRKYKNNSYHNVYPA
jgi:hypothetical protein